MTTIQTKRWPRRWIWFPALFLIGILALAFAPNAQAQVWTSRADMPSPRGFLASTAVADKIYVIGGSLGGNTAPANDPNDTLIEVYDPATDTWTQKVDMPLVRVTAAATTMDGKIYVVGARAFNAGGVELLVYDPATDTWTQKADMPEERRHMAAAVVDGKLYTFGGGVRNGGGVGSPTVFAYDPVTDTWTQKVDMPRPGIWLTDSACAVDGKIYVMGISPETFGEPLHEVYMYDPGTDSWSQKADMPTNRVSLATAVVDGKIYAIGGGTTPADGSKAVVEAYDPATDSWSAVSDLITPRHGTTAAAMDGKIYVFGGFSPSGPLASDLAVEAFTPVTGSTAIASTTWGRIKSLLK